MPKFRLFGSGALTMIHAEIRLNHDDPTARLSLAGSASDGHLARQGNDLIFSLPADQSAYLLQPGNTRGFKSRQKTFIPLPAGKLLRGAVSPAQTSASATLYLFVCDESGAPLVRKALKLDNDNEEVVFRRPAGATKAFVAIRLVGQGRLRPFTLAFEAAPVEAQIDPFFSTAVRMLAQRGEDDLLMDYLTLAMKLQGPIGQKRHLGAAANDAARAKRFKVEAKCLQMLHEATPSPTLEQKIARSHYRNADYPSLAQTIDRWPHVLRAREQGPFFGAAEEIRAAAALADRLQTPHPQRYRPLGLAPRMAYCLHNSLPYASGGYATRSHGLMRGMAAAGRRGVVLARPGFPSDTKSGTGAPEGRSVRRIDGTTYRFENSFDRKGQLYRYMVRAGEYFADTAPRDVTIIQAASNFYTGLAGAYAAAARRLPFVYEVRGFWELTRESRDAAFAQTPLYERNRRLEQACAHLADHVLTLTPSMKSEIESWGVPSERVTLAPNAVDPETFKPLPRDVRLAERLGLSPEDLVIGYIGSFVDYEGLDMLVDATLRLMVKDARVRLLIVGDDTPGGRASVPVGEELRARVAASGMAERVLFTGRISHEEVPAHYSLIDICPFPRRPLPVCEMVSPMKPLEAMAMGKCVIVSSVGGMEGMVRDEETGLVFAKGDPGALYGALSKAADPEVRARLGRKAREWVTRERAWTTVGASVADLHAALTSGDAGFRNRPHEYAAALERFAQTFPILPVVEAAGDFLNRNTESDEEDPVPFRD